MSGHKRALVQLGRQDLRRFDAIQDRLRQVEQDYHEVRESIHTDRQQQLDHFTKEIETRQQIYLTVLDNYDQGISNLEKQTGEALLNQANYLSGQIERQEQRITHDNQTLLENYFQSMSMLMQENQQEVWDHFNFLRDEFNQTLNESHRHQVLAEQALVKASGLLNSINEVYDHDHYFPGGIDRIRVDIENAFFNLNNGMYEAALITAQQSSRDLTYMRLSMEETMQRTALAQSFAIEKVHELCSLVQKNAFVYAVDLEGNNLDTLIDVDFWTSGSLTNLYTRCEGLLKQLEEDQHGSGIEEYERMLEFILPQLEQSLGDLIAEARIKVILSQIRYNIAETVIDNLAEQGFTVQKAIYNEMDERQPYAVIARSLEGSQVKVCIESGDHPGSYSLQIDSQEPGLYNQSELRNRASTLLRCLQMAGLRVGQVTEIPGRDSRQVIQEETGKYKYKSQPLVNRNGN